MAGLVASNGGGTLSGVTFDGTLSLTASSAYVHLANGLKMAGSNGGGSGTINVAGPSAFLYFDNSETVSNATINLGNSAGGSDYLYEYDTGNAGNQVLTSPPTTRSTCKGTRRYTAAAFPATGLSTRA